MAEPANDPNALLLLGEIRGQLRELIHTGNNNSTKIDALAMRINSLEQIVPKVEAFELVAGKVEALQRERDQREGATGVLAIILKSPLIAWLISAALAAWAVLSGKVDL